jgi:hypothetical protein
MADVEDVKVNKLIEKIAKLKQKPVRLSGYLAESAEEDALHLYPNLDPGHYFAFSKDCIVDIFPTAGDTTDHVTVLLDATCEVECVIREHKRASDLAGGTKLKTACGCAPSGAGTSAMDFQDHLISLARLLLSMGIDQFDCKKFGSTSGLAHGCCAAWNDLLSDIKNGGNGIFSAEYLERACAT